MGFNIINYNFFSDVFEHHKINVLYKSVSNSFNDTDIDLENYGDVDPFLSSSINTFKFVPDYLKTTVIDKVVINKVFFKLGYLANLKAYNSVDYYLRNGCKRKFRYNVLNPFKRLESCFNITYKIFIGSNIAFSEYEALMGVFHQMLTTRFDQRNDRNTVLKNWDCYFKIAFNLIVKKKASLFIIFNEEEPIAFTLNFHCDTILYFAVPTFNLDYAKFTPGNVAIYKVMEWCFQNNYQLFDMGYGTLPYKTSWCNTTYNYEHHVLHHPGNRMGRLYAFFLRYRFRIFNYLLSKKVNVIFKNLINTLKGKKGLPTLSYTLQDIENRDSLNTCDLLNINLIDSEYKYLKKPLYDFLYLNMEHRDHVQVYKLNNAPQQYIFKGKAAIANLKIN